MIFTETRINGVYLVRPERLQDERGFFSRTWCASEFADQGLSSELLQCNLSFNHTQGTLRGLHYQVAPQQEAKLVRCTMGAIYDVAVDLRPDSESYLRWVSAELTAENRAMHYLPEGIAHGFVTLCNNTEIFYQMSSNYEPVLARGVRWDDPAFQIEWPTTVRKISEKDMNYPDYAPDKM